MMRHLWVIICIAELSGSACLADSQSQYNDLFGAEASKVAATASLQDDTDFADKLLASVDTLKDDPQLAILLLEKAYEFGIKHPNGISTATEALTRLVELDQSRAPEWSEKLWPAWQLQYQKCSGVDKAEAGEQLIRRQMTIAATMTTPDNIAKAVEACEQALAIARSIQSPRTTVVSQTLQGLQLRQATYVKVAKLKASLAGAPNNGEIAKSIALAYVVELNEPAEGLSQAGDALDADLRKKLAGAVKPLEKTTEDECLELGEWYQGLAKSAQKSAQIPLYRQALGYYRRFLSLHTKADAAKLKGQMAFTQVRTELANRGQGDRWPYDKSVLAITPDAKVKAAVEKGVAYLWSRQRANGSWTSDSLSSLSSSSLSSSSSSADVTTSLAIFALLESGAQVKDERVRRALDYLDKQSSSSTDCLGLSCCAYLAADRQSPGQYTQQLANAAGKLLSSTKNGAFYSSCPGGRTIRSATYYSTYYWDNSSSQFAIMGIAAASKGGLQVPQAFWQAAAKHWNDNQASNGTWARSKSSEAGSVAMTAAGAASLATCLSQLNGDRRAVLNAPAMAKACVWLDANAAIMTQDLYTSTCMSEEYGMLYSMSRVGLVRGTTTFGKTDWYKAGCDLLLGRPISVSESSVRARLGGQSSDGSWSGARGTTISTSFAILFLSMGLDTEQQ